MIVALVLTAAVAPGPLDVHLQPLSFLVGYCWRGEFKDSGAVDTHCFESVYDGKHVRDRHEVTGTKGIYRGESIYSWNGQAKRVEYVYFNSLGGVSHGAMQVQGANLRFDNERHGRLDGSSVTFATSWRPIGEDAYEVLTHWRASPTGEVSVVYRRTSPVSLSAAN